MNAEDKILKQLENNNGIITTAEVTKMGIERKTLTRMVKKGLIERDKRGIYISIDSFGDEYYSLTHNSSKAIFSHFTALYFHNMCERPPLIYDITIPMHYSSNLLNNKKISIYYAKDEVLNLGKIKIQSPQGQFINAYDIERCLCDIVKIKDKVDIEMIKYAYKSYLKSPKKDLVKIMEYAKKLNCSKDVHSFIEVIS